MTDFTEKKQFFLLTLVFPIFIIIVLFFSLDFYAFLIEYILLFIILGNLIWFLRNPKKYSNLIKSYVTIERTVLPSFYNNFYDSKVFRILRFLVGFIFFFSCFNFKVITKKEVILKLYNIVIQHSVLWIPFIIFIVIFLIMLFDIFFVNFFLLFHSNEIMKRTYLQAGYSQIITNSGVFYVKKCLLIGGKFGCKFAASSILGAGH